MLAQVDQHLLIALLIGIAVVLVAEAVYLVFFAKRSYRTSINRRLQISAKQSDREAILLQLRRERGLSADGNYSLPIADLNKLIVQSGLTFGATRLMFMFLGLAIFIGLMTYANTFNPLYALGAFVFGATLLPLLVLKFLRGRRHAAFGKQFPDAIDIIVRSLKAGHPIPVALSMVARELPDPVGTEFGLVGDEVSYGADIETAMRNLYYRVGQDDLPLFVTAIAIQTSTGGNLSEILSNLSRVIRERFKMRRKIRALSSEGKFSAMALSALPLLVLAVVTWSSPDFYGDVWHIPLTKIILGMAGGWMVFGNLVMMKMVNFKI